MMRKKHGAKLVYFLILCWFVSFHDAMAQENATVPVKVGVVLDVSGTLTGKMGLTCINMALSDFYSSHSHYNTRLVFNVRDSQRDVVTAAAQALDLIENKEVQAIIGLSTSMQANFVIRLGEKAHVPIITFSATSPSLTSLSSLYSFRISQNDSAQVNAISAIVQAFGWREAVPIYVDNDFGEGVIPYLTSALQEVYVRIPYLSAISPSATDEDITEELYKFITMQTRVFIVHMSPNLGSRLLTIANQIGMMSQGYVWIVTDGIGNVLNSFNSSVLETMEGVLGVKTYIPRTEQLDDFKVRWKRRFLQEYPDLVYTNLNAFGLWAYDATTALAMAVEKVGSTNFSFEMQKSSSNLADLQRFGISQNGRRLREALADTRFRGLSGEVNVVDGQLQASTFEIVNVNGNGARRVGFWTSQNGLTRNLGLEDTRTYSTSLNNLGPIIWPGDTSSIPKGWVIPAIEKKLRIGVPVKNGFTEFVKVTNDASTKTVEVAGFSIDVFKASLEVLPYALPYDFIPFAKPNGESAGTYNELISQVYYGDFDAVVGDTTITANRSNYVDFTMPYTESGVSMVVPVKENKKKNAWAFLKPLTRDLWITTAFSFIFVGFVVWVLEHRINENFRGPPSNQIGTSLWFSFSIMVSAHREKVVNNWARFVVIIWVFVVLILVQSYTASLTSLLTVEQLRPTITDVNLLIKNRLNVGYLDGSFVYGMLLNMGFKDFQLKPYNSAEGMDELFTKGSANGGIDAAFDAIPNLKLFLGTYCSKYTKVEPTYKTDGFGFVFPMGSTLVADMSRAILNVTQGERMKTIENAWFKRSNCPDPSDTTVSSDNLGLDSFWGLFLIAGVASASALIIFLATFLYQHRHIWFANNPDSSIWKRIGVLLRSFDHKDMSSHTFRKSERQDKSETGNSHRGSSAVESSPGTHCPPSPSSQTESNFSFSADYGEANPHGQVTPDIEPTIVQNVPLARTTTADTRIAPADNCLCKI